MRASKRGTGTDNVPVIGPRNDDAFDLMANHNQLVRKEADLEQRLAAALRALYRLRYIHRHKRKKPKHGWPGRYRYIY